MAFRGKFELHAWSPPFSARWCSIKATPPACSLLRSVCLRAAAQRSHHLRGFCRGAALQRGAVCQSGGVAAGRDDRQAARAGARDSDLYEDEAALRRSSASSNGHDVIVIHTLARDELTWSRGAAEFATRERPHAMVQPAAARESYVAAIESWLTRWRGNCGGRALITCA